MASDGGNFESRRLIVCVNPIALQSFEPASQLIIPFFVFVSAYVGFGSARTRLKFRDTGRGMGGGQLPEVGAIFMSNAGTKEECLEKMLFGLPYSHVDFVRRVKAGMILFLFEYERRELHGVFEAASDGEVNIISSAYTSSGKQFPAQVLGSLNCLQLLLLR